MYRTVGDLDSEDRSALERVVGHRLRENQQIVIQVVGLVVAPPAPVSSGSAAPLPDWCGVYDGLTDDQVDDLDRAIVRSPSSRDVA